MFFRIGYVLSLFFLVAGGPAPAPAYDIVPGYEETQLRFALREEVSQAFSDGYFEVVEQMAAGFRKTNERTPSGIEKISILWEGIDSALGVQYSRATGDPLMELIDQYERAYPESPTPYIARSRLIARRAWAERGNGFSSEVPPEAWSKFLSGMEQAKEVLLKHKDLATADPEYYVGLVGLEGGVHGLTDQMLEIAREGRRKFPGYLSLYQNPAIFMLPQWSGSRFAVEIFARESVEETRQSDGEGMYARIYWPIIGYTRTDEFHQLALDWPTMKRAMRDVLARYPERWNANIFASFACMAGDREETRYMLDIVDGKPDTNAWFYDDARYQICRDWAYGQPKPGGGSPIREIKGKLKSFVVETN